MKKLFISIALVCLFVPNETNSQTVLGGRFELRSLNLNDISFKKEGENIFRVYYHVGLGNIVPIDVIHIYGDSIQLISPGLLQEIYFYSENSVPLSVFQKSIEVPMYGHWPKTRIQNEELILTKIIHPKFTELHLKYEINLSPEAKSHLKAPIILLLAAGLMCSLLILSLHKELKSKRRTYPSAWNFLFLGFFVGVFFCLAFVREKETPQRWIQLGMAYMLLGEYVLTLIIGAVLYFVHKRKK